jgi:hypothetical protein
LQQSDLASTSPSPSATWTHESKLAIVILGIIIGLTAYHFAHLRFSMTHEYRYATREALASGTASRPFQYRILVPGIVKFVSQTTPLSTFRVYKICEQISAFAIAVAFFYMTGLFFNGTIARLVMTFALFLILPFNYLLTHDVWYANDLPLVFFFIVGFSLLYRERWHWYYPVFILATFNHEASGFLAVIYACAAWKQKPFGHIALHIGIQATLWILIKLYLHIRFQGNPGMVLENHFITNMLYFLQPKNLPLVFSNLGFMWIAVFALNHHIHDVFVRRSLLVWIPFLGVMLYACHIFELRDYGMFTPQILIAFLLIFKNVNKHIELSKTGKNNSTDI